LCAPPSPPKVFPMGGLPLTGSPLAPLFYFFQSHVYGLFALVSGSPLWFPYLFPFSASSAVSSLFRQLFRRCIKTVISQTPLEANPVVVCFFAPPPFSLFFGRARRFPGWVADSPATSFPPEFPPVNRIFDPFFCTPPNLTSLNLP